jgi:hypothetical protein
MGSLKTGSTVPPGTRSGTLWWCFPLDALYWPAWVYHSCWTVARACPAVGVEGYVRFGPRLGKMFYCWGMHTRILLLTGLLSPVFARAQTLPNQATTIVRRLPAFGAVALRSVAKMLASQGFAPLLLNNQIRLSHTGINFCGHGATFSPFWCHPPVVGGGAVHGPATRGAGEQRPDYF